MAFEKAVAVSVIVPAYNASRTIGACVQSLLAQVPRPAEVLVVDDCSDDDTTGAAAHAGAAVIRLERNSGPGVARNIGAAAARGAVLAFTDADCVAPAGWLRHLVSALDEPGVVAVTGGYAGPVRESFLTRLQHLVIRERQAALPTHIESAITSNFACRKSDFEAVGGFPVYYRRGDPAMPVWGNEDEEFGHLLAKSGRKIRWLPDGGVLHLFRLDLGGYLRQQHFYAERIVMSHVRFPALARTRSNYSRRSGALHLAAAAGVAFGSLAALAGAIGVPGAQALGVAVLGVSTPLYLSLPVATLAGLRRRGEPLRFLGRAYFVLLAVNLAWLSGAVRGLLSSFGGFIDGNGESAAASAAARQ